MIHTYTHQKKKKKKQEESNSIEFSHLNMYYYKYFVNIERLIVSSIGDKNCGRRVYKIVLQDILSKHSLAYIVENIT